MRIFTRSKDYRTGLRGTTAAAALVTGFLAVSPCMAQASAQSSASVSAETSAAPADIVVTGTRVGRNGYNAPTPVTVLSAEALNASGRLNVSDTLNQLPALSQSVTPSAQPAGYGGGSLGANELNLRSLGTNRTLVLQDGKRMVNTSLSTNFGAPDVNTVPNALITRVDVVTGGASAAYGSDAVAGVVNFVLDHKFSGLKGEAEGGISTYGDDKQYRFSLTAGKAFGPDGRGHITLSGELAKNEGVTGNTRPWNDISASVITNPNYTATNGQPFYLVARQTGLSNGTPGGLITTGPLRGVVFGPGGTPTTFNFGLVSGNNVMAGGDWRYSRIDNLVSIDPTLLRQNVYGRLSYEIADGIELYGEAQYSHTDSRNAAVPNRFLGNALTIRSDNAFIPASVAAQLAALGQTSFSLGTTNADIGLAVAENRRTLQRYNAGVTGSFSVFGKSWQWDASYQRSIQDVHSEASNAVNIANYMLAADAVRNPATGAIVCRSTLSNPGNGCVPYNALGIGVNSRAAIGYVTGVSYIDQTLKQDVVAGNLHGDAFSTWAGPVSVALGIEHRRESVTGLASALDEANAYLLGDYHATFGAYSVTEGYFEAVVPLAKDLIWAKTLDLNGAVRGTSYSTSGYVTTWKVGGVYEPFAGLRFRGTKSRDIRAPNLGELFSAGQSSTGAPLSDPFTNTTVSGSNALAKGNPDLKPEVADTFEVGAIVSPSFLPGFQASVDFYKINVTNAVQYPAAQTIINLCFQGNTALCPDIIRTGGVITTVITQPTNIQGQKTRGLDFEASYRMPLSRISSDLPGVFSIRALGTYVLSLKSTDSLGNVVEGAGVLGGRFGAFGSTISTGLSAPSFTSTVFVNYDYQRVSAQMTMRYVGPGKYNNAFAECSSGCPLNSQYSINDNHIAGNAVFDISLTYRPTGKVGNELFFGVSNVFNKAPPIIGGNTVNTYYLGQANSDYYDRIGRTFRAGIRFKL